MTNNPSLPRSTPEAQGISSKAILAFVDAVEQQELELHSLMLLRHGHVVAEGWWSPYSADRIHLLYSLSKSFTATAIGLAISEGRLSVDDPVISFFPDKQPQSANAHLSSMQVHHLLSMATGHREDALPKLREQATDDWVAAFFAIPPDREPGSVFAYNNAATFILAAILHKLTGMKLVDYLQPRLFAPLGIDQTYWLENPLGINLGFSGLHITTDAIARFGQVFLQKGRWQGQQIVPEKYVELAMAKHIDNASGADDEKPDWGQGYGYQFWRCRHNAYRADGAFGQFCLIMPDQDAVLATTAGVQNMQSVLDLVWEHLLPAMEPAAISDNVAAQHQLGQRLEKLAIQLPQGEATSPLAMSVTGNCYDFSQHENPYCKALTLHFAEESCSLTVLNDQGEHHIQAGYNNWIEDTSTIFDTKDEPVTSSGIWTASNTFRLDICNIQTPHRLMVILQFQEDDIVQLNLNINVNFGPTELAAMEGRLKSPIPTT